MGTFAKHMVLCHTNMTIHHKDANIRLPLATGQSPVASGSELPPSRTRRLAVLSTVLAASGALGLLRQPQCAQAEAWGTRSYIKERYFQPGLSPEEAAARIRQTAEGMHELRQMLEGMSWRYVMFYIRLKSAYLDLDLKNAVATLPENRRPLFVKAANELVDNMAEFDYYVRTPKVYESYVYYEKTLKSLDDVVALLA